MRTFLHIIIFLLTLSYGGHAQTTWTGGGDGTTWTDLGNWSAGVPTTPYGNTITIDGTGSPVLPSDFTTDGLIINDAADLNLDGHTLTVNNSFDTQNTDNAKTVRNGTLNVGTSGARADVPDIRGVSFGAGISTEVCNITFYTANTTRFQRLRENNFYGTVLFDIETGVGENWNESEGNTFYGVTDILISGDQHFVLGKDPTNPNTFKSTTTITNNGDKRVYIGTSGTFVSATDYTTIFEGDVTFINNGLTGGDSNPGFYLHWNKAQVRFEGRIRIENNSTHFRSNYWWNASVADGECSLGDNAYFDMIISGGTAFLTSFTQNTTSTVTHTFEVENTGTLELGNNLDFPSLHKAGNLPFPADVILKTTNITSGNALRVAQDAGSTVSVGGNATYTDNGSSVGTSLLLAEDGTFTCDGDVELNLNSTSDAYIARDNGSSATIDGTLDINIPSTGSVYLARNTGASLMLNGDVTLNMTDAGRIEFSINGGATTLGAGVNIDASTTTDGVIWVQDVTQTAGGTPNHNFMTNASTELYFIDNTLHGNFIAEGNRMQFRGNTMGTNNTNTASITLSAGSANVDNSGGNTFHGVTTINHNANGLNWSWGHSDGGADTFNANVTFNNNASNTAVSPATNGYFTIANNTLNNTFNGEATFNNTSSGFLYLTSPNIGGFNATVDKSAIFNGDVSFTNSSDGGSPSGRHNAIAIGREGGSRVTFNEDVSFTNNASNGIDANISVGTYGGVTFNSNITITQNGTSSAFSTHDHYQQSGQIYFEGTTDQTITSNQELIFRYLELNKTVGTKLILGSNTLIRRGSNNAILNAELIINSGHIELGNNNLTLEYHATRPANLTGGDANNYIITNGTGYLNMRVEGTNKLFPIGPSDSQYLPITLNNGGGTDDNYSVRAIYDTYETYDVSNNPTGTDITEYFVNNSWAIQEDVIGGSNLVVTPQWGAGDELTNFDRTQSSVNRYNHDDNEWNCGGADAAASGADPYTHTSCAFTSTSTNNIGVISVASTVANAGTDITIGGCGSTNLSAIIPAGTSTNTQGSWSFVSSSSGITPTIADPNDPNTAISSMSASGTYTFRWTTQKASNCATCTSQQDDVDVIYTYSPPGVTTTAVWTGLANNGRWDDCLNWTSLDLPDATGANITIPNVGTLAYPILPNDVNIINLDIQSGAGLDLDGYTAFISGTSSVIDADIISNGGTFEKTSTSNDTWAGGNTFTGDITFRHSGAGGTWILAGTNADDFNATNGTTTNTITFDIANAAANIIPAYNGNTTIEGTITINSVANTDFHFGDISGNTGGITLDGGTTSHNRITYINNNLPAGQKIVYYNFTMNKDTGAGAWDGGVEVDGTSHIQNVLTLTFGHIKMLDGAIFSVQNSAVNAVQPNAFNTRSLIFAQGTGVFGRQVLNNATDYVFPIGRHGYNGTVGLDRRYWKMALEYTLNLAVGSDADEFFIRLDRTGSHPKTTYDLSNNGSGGNLDQEYINNTWVVTHANTTANFDAIAKVQWYEDAPFRLFEQADFTPDRAFITRYDYTTGEWKCVQEASIANQITAPDALTPAPDRLNRLAMTTGVNKASNGNFGVFSVASATADVSNTSTAQTSCGNIILDASAVFESAAEGVWTTTAPGVIISDPSNPVTTAVNILSSGTYSFTWTRESVECGTNIHAQTVNINVTIGGTPSITQTWTGAKNTNWFDCANWTDGIPTATTDVIIPNDAVRYPVLTADVTAINSLTFDDNGTTTGATIDFAGFTLNTGTLEVKDWTAGTVDRTIGTGTGTLDVEGRFIINGRTSKVIFDVACDFANLAGDTDHSYIYDTDFERATTITNRKTSTWQGILIGNEAADVTNFNNTVTFTIDSESSIRVAHNSSTVNFNDDVTFTGTTNATGDEARLQLGDDNGTTGNINLADGKALTTNNFDSGRLWISQVTQTGATDTHTHNLDQVSPAELRLRNNTLLGNFEVTAVLLEFRDNTFNSNAGNTTNITGETEVDEDTFSGGNTFNGETWITNSGRGEMHFGHSGADIFETDAHFVASESTTPITPEERKDDYSTTYTTTFNTGHNTGYTTPVDYITKPYYVTGDDPATWVGTTVGFASYPRATNLATNTADPVTNANNASTNSANDTDNKSDESASETNIADALDNVQDAADNADDAYDNLNNAINAGNSAASVITSDDGYTAEGGTGPINTARDNLLALIASYNGQLATTQTAETDANNEASDASNAPGNDNTQANTTNGEANTANDYANQINQAIIDMHDAINAANTAYNASISAAITAGQNAGVLGIARSSGTSIFKGNTDFLATDKGRILISDQGGDATFEGTVDIDNQSQGNGSLAYEIGELTGSDLIFQDVVTITQQHDQGDIRLGLKGTVDFQENLILNNTTNEGQTHIGWDNTDATITVQKDIITSLSDGLIELSNIDKTSTTPLTIDVTGNGRLVMRGNSTIRGTTNIIDNSTLKGVRISTTSGHTITFEDDVLLENKSDSEIEVSRLGDTNFNGNLVIENEHAFASGNSLAFEFGFSGTGGGTTTLATGKTITIGPDGFDKGTLGLFTFVQLGVTPQNIVLSDDGVTATAATITSEAQINTGQGTTFGGDVTFEAAVLGINNSTFNGEGELIAWEEGEGSGGNTFNDLAFFELRGTGTGWSIGRGATGDTFNDNVQFWNNGNNSVMRVADEGPASSFFGTQVTIINGNGTPTGCNFELARLAGSSATFDSNVLIDNRDATGNITVGHNGTVVFNNPVTLRNGSSTLWQGNLAMGGWATGTYAGSITFSTTSSLTLDAGTTWDRGALILRNTSYLPTTALDIVQNSANDSRIYMGPNSTFEADVSGTTRSFYLNGATFNGTATFRKEGGWNNISRGGNVFNGNVHLTNATTGYGSLYLADEEDDDYNADVTFEIINSTAPSTGTGTIVPADRFTASFAGNVTVISDKDQDFLFSGTGSFTPTSSAGTGTVRFDGTGTQTVTNNISNASRILYFRNLEMYQIGTTDLLETNRDFTVTNACEFSMGKINLGTVNMTIENSSSGTSVLVLNVNDSHVIATSSGEVIREVPNTSTNVIFPVGTINTYLPATMANSGTTDTYRVRLIDDIYLSYGASPTFTPTGANITAHFTKRTWVIDENTIGGSNIDLTLQWDPADELPNFDRNLVSVVQYNNSTSKWRCTQTAGAAVGTAGLNLRRSTSNITFMGAFSVATVNADAGPDQITCGPGIVSMAAQELVAPFSGTWVYVSGPTDYSFDDASDHNSDVTLPSASSTYVFEWQNDGLEGACGTAVSQVSIDVGSGTIGPAPVFVTWTGTQDTDWFNCNNWSPNYIPSATISAVIPDVSSLPNQPVIETSGPACNNLTIQNGGHVQLNNVGILEVAGNVDIQSGASINNSASFTEVRVTGNFANLGTVQNTNLIIIGGDFTQNGTLNQNLATAEIRLTGNLTSNVAMNFTQGKFLLQGSTDTEISGTGTLNFFDLEVDKSGTANVNLDKAVSLSGSLFLTSGLIQTSNANLLTLRAGAVSTTGNATSYVNGPMRKIGDTPFTFPVGKGGYWARIGISNLASTNVNDYFTAEYFHYTYSDRTVHDLNHVSSLEHWILDRNASGTTEAKVTLFWESGTRSEIVDVAISDLKVAHYTASAWYDRGGVISGTAAQGNITTTARQSVFSPWTFGSTTGVNPLPVRLLSFEAEKVEGDQTANLTWSTAIEENASHFEVEHSANAIDFEKINQVEASGNSLTRKDYSVLDESPLLGINYYRLKMVDQDGSFEYSPVRSLEFDGGTTLSWEDIYPNPFLNILNVAFNLNKGATYQILVYDVQGRLVKEFATEIAEGARVEQSLNLSELAAQTYLLKIRTAQSEIIRRIVKK